MNARQFLPDNARRKVLRIGLIALWSSQWLLLLWAVLTLQARGWSLPAAAGTCLLLWLCLQWTLVILGYGLKWLLGDWPAAVRGSPLRMLRTLALEVLWMTRFYLIEQPWRAAPMQLNSADPRPPLLLVHGFLCNGAVWNPLAKRLGRQGRSFISVCLEPSYRDFEKQLADLDLAVLAWLAHTGRPQLTLIGHSMGGLLVRAYVERHPQRCAAVICVAAPHHGTFLGDWFHGLEGGPPSPRCQWLQRFNRRSGEHIAIPALNLWSADDAIVLPASSARLAATPERAEHGYGHMALVAAPQPCAALMQALQQFELAGEQTE